MPSRFAAVLIALFWLGTLGYVGYRDVWPRYFSDAPPPLHIDLADEATQLNAVRWTIRRGGQPIGTLQSWMQYVPDERFRFVNTYARLKLEGAAGLTIEAPRLETVVVVDRAGALLEQSLNAELQLRLGPVLLGDGQVQVQGTVAGGELRGRCQAWYPATSKAAAFARDLDPVPVPAGQVLNPMMPVNRLRDVQPGRRWVVREVDPLREAGAALFRELLKDAPSELARTALPKGGSQELLAEVLSDPETLERPSGAKVSCWVIVYRGAPGADGAEARTWVSRADGRVLRQQATGAGEQLQFDREE